MDLVVVGSIPTRHPKGVSNAYTFFNAPVAHLDRATDFESVGSTFESCQAQTKCCFVSKKISKMIKHFCLNHLIQIKRFDILFYVNNLY